LEKVQFNPQTLKLTYANENRGGNQPAGSSQQFIGNSTTRLSVDLFFDTTQDGTDVRYWTSKVGYFIRPLQNQRIPPGISFEWGRFKFPGIVDSIEETLDYFSEDGVPLRATIALKLTRQEIVFPTEQETGRPGDALRGQPGQAPLDIVRANSNGTGTRDNIAKMAGRNGKSSDWKNIAAANNIDNPLRPRPGTLLNLNASASARAGVSLGAQSGLSASAGISSKAGFSAGLGGGIGFSAGARGGIDVSGGVRASAGIGGGIGVGLGANTGAGTSATGSIGGATGAGISGVAGASANVSGLASGSIGVSGSSTGQAGIGGRVNTVTGGGFGIGVDKPKR
ncbi:hypothetical protein, partial [Nitrosomonas nitrosa]|uniref:CIS tube protein n=1 Tax=Nitrosomonas nitrosa TaxID=52442 RepID=UPI0023F66DF4